MGTARGAVLPRSSKLVVTRQKIRHPLEYHSWHGFSSGVFSWIPLPSLNLSVSCSSTLPLWRFYAELGAAYCASVYDGLRDAHDVSAKNCPATPNRVAPRLPYRPIMLVDRIVLRVIARWLDALRVAIHMPAPSFGAARIIRSVAERGRSSQKLEYRNPKLEPCR